MTPFEEIERDLDWRESELASLRRLLSNKEVSSREKDVLFRAAWALLYAHYEGFCKFALTVYFDTIKKPPNKCRDLPFQTQCFALSGAIKSIRTLPTVEFLNSFHSFDRTFLDASIEFPEVETKSNLWPHTFRELLTSADIEVKSLDDYNQTIRTLVTRRNKIAHGEKDMIKELSYYLKFEDAIMVVLCDLALSIDKKINGSR